MIAAIWPWIVGGAAFVFVVGLVVMLLVGVVGMSGDFLRRTRQSTAARQELPDDVPAASAEETARLAEPEQEGRPPGRPSSP